MKNIILFLKFPLIVIHTIFLVVVFLFFIITLPAFIFLSPEGKFFGEGKGSDWFDKLYYWVGVEGELLKTFTFIWLIVVGVLMLTALF